MKKRTTGIVLLIGAICFTAQATDIYKADNGTLLNNGGSWVGGVVPTSSDTVFFAGNTAARSAATAVYNHNWVGIVITNSTFKWTINNNNNRPIRLGTGGITMGSGNTGAFQMDPQVALLADQTWTVTDEGQTVTVNGPVINAAGGSLNSGSIALTKAGAGTLVLNGTNTFSGGFTINAGSVTAGDNEALGVGTVTMNGGALNASGKTLTNNFVIAGSVSMAGNTSLAGTLSGAGSLTYTPAGPAFKLSLSSDNSSFSGAITNNAIIVMGHKNSLGTGLVTMNDGSSLAGSGGAKTGANSISNNFVVNGTLKFGATAATADMELTGMISGSGGVSNGHTLVTTILSGLNTYDGLTTVALGKMLIEGDNSGATGDVTVNAAAGFGGNGTVGGNVHFDDGAQFLFDAAKTLTVVAGKEVTFAAFDMLDVIGVDLNTALGTYTLIAGNVNFANISNVGIANAFDLGGGKSAYFQQGSLELVVIPEPATIGMLGLGALITLMIRRMRPPC